MKAIEYLRITYDSENEYQVRPAVKCKDGFTVSIQGGTHFHYCEPREKRNVYESVELGFPSKEDEIINYYAENSEDYTGTVYGYVPIDVVENLIEKHGGIVDKMIPPTEKD